MRVLEIITGGEPGGAQRHVKELSQYLRANDHEVMVMHGGGQWLTESLGPEFPTRYVASLGRTPRPDQDIDAARQMATAISEYHPHVVHLHSSKAGILGRWVAWRRRVPAVYTAHGYVFQDPTLSGAARSVYRQLEGWAASRSAATIVVSHRDLAFATAHTRGHNAHYITNGVGRAAIGSHSLHVPPVVGFMGRFSREKGLDWLIPIAAQHPEYVWRFAGDGGLRAILTDAATRYPHVLWDGWVDNLDAWFHEVDVLVQPSWKEGTPYTLLDGLARGVPAVGSRVGGIPEILGPIDPALLITPGQAGELMTAIHHALAYREQLKNAIWSHLEDHFDRDAQLAKVVGVLGKAARR